MSSPHAPRRVSIAAPAKVNLTLEILARRPDGFHELETLMLGISAGDRLTIRATESPEIILRCHWALGLQAERRSRQTQTGSVHSAAANVWSELPPASNNLVYKALVRLQTVAQVTKGAEVTLAKHIPAQAGLGGASADAAAALLAANEVWQLHWSTEQLAEIAAQLGSDVPFFLHGGLAICRGRGERIEMVRSARCSLVVVRPGDGLSTPAVYKRCRPEPLRNAAKKTHAALIRGDLATSARGMHNGLQAPAEELSPQIAELKEAFAQVGAAAHQMSGSGSSYFGLFWHQGQARRAARRLRGQNLGAVMLASSAMSQDRNSALATNSPVTTYT